MRICDTVDRAFNEKVKKGKGAGKNLPIMSSFKDGTLGKVHQTASLFGVGERKEPTQEYSELVQQEKIRKAAEKRARKAGKE